MTDKGFDFGPKFYYPDFGPFMQSPEQLSFDFADGYAAAVSEWREAQETLARKLGLPLGRRVRVEFENGDGLEGLLQLDDQTLFTPDRRTADLLLRIGNASFAAKDIASCMRLD